MKLAEVTSINVNRTKTEMEEFNRVLGGGVVPGSLCPHRWGSRIGKSTFSYKSQLSCPQVGTVLSTSVGEESAQQIKLRAERLGILIVSFIFMQEPICRVFELRWSASSQTSSSSTPFRLLCLLRFQGCRDLFLRCVR